MSYVPEEVPSGESVLDLAAYVGRELSRISNALQADTISINILHVEPLKPKELTFAAADGTDWNPGLGAGVYVFINGVWEKIAYV